ncbi:MAG: hypothetical protein VB121_12975 [Enterococcus thailandicus]|nr:hypothetical protein [Enterococcus thailandicus]
MKLFSEIKRIFQCEEICISERRNTVEASFVTTILRLPNVASILTICDLVPSRDTLIMSLKNDSDDIVSVSNKKPTMPDFTKLIDGMAQDDTIEIKIQINKTVSARKFSIYNFKTFSEDLLHVSIVGILKWFSELLSSQEYLVFEVFDSDISFSTGTMAFVSNDNSVFSPKLERNQRLRICKETAFFYNMNTFEVIPEDFEIEGIEQKNNCFRSLFEKMSTILSLIYVASSASIEETTLNVQINGQRTMTYSYELSGIHYNARLVSIYAWIYTDGNPTDKALIAHNVISLHCKYADLLTIDEKVYDAIKSNYNLYLRNNVVHYLELKKDISTFIRDVVAQVGDYAVSILNKFKTNLIAIFVFLFTVILTKIGSAQKWENIFSRDTVYIIELVVIGSLVYLGICIFEARYKLNKTKQAYDALKNNYEDILSQEEIKEAFGKDKLLDDTERSAIKGMILWSSIWGALLIATILVIELLTSNRGVLSWLFQKIF